jgi:hypothetical protein
MSAVGHTAPFVVDESDNAGGHRIYVDPWG